MSSTAAWDLIWHEGVMEVIEGCARRVARRYERFVDAEDLIPEAFIKVPTTSDLAEAINLGELGLLDYRLERALIDHCDMAFAVPRNDPSGAVKRPEHTAIKQTGQINVHADGSKAYVANTYSYEGLTQEADDDEGGSYLAPHVVVNTASGSYTRESVQTLLPAVWDESFVYGLPQRDDAPDPDMPKGATNKARGNNLSAYIADVKTGWNEAPLTMIERQVLIMAFGLGWNSRMIGEERGVARQVVERSIVTGVGKVRDRMNGARKPINYTKTRSQKNS